MVDAYELDHVVEVPEEIIDGGLGRRTDKSREPIDPDQPAGRGCGLDLCIADIAWAGEHGRRVGMREHERPGGSFDRFKRRPFAGMRAVHDDAHLVQPLHQVAAEAREARVAGLLAAVAHAIADIVGELHHAHAERVVRVHEVQVALDRVGALEVENQPELAVLLGCGDVGRLPHQHEIRARVDQAMPAAEVAKRLFR